MSTHRTSISLPKSLYSEAERRMKETFHTSFSEYVSSLVREDARAHPARGDILPRLGDTVKVVENTYGHLIPQDADINAAWK